MELPFTDFSDPGVWISLVTLCFLEIVLGIDNIIFISIVAGKLPAQQQRKARNIGLLLAMVFRVCLLLFINLIIGLKEPVITIPALEWFRTATLDLSYKDLILIGGGIFLMVKSTLEIHHKLNKPDQHMAKAQSGTSRLSLILLQIVMVDAVFSFDSILTAIGLVENIVIMIIAVVVSIGIMMLFAGPVSGVITRQPTLQMLALSFLIVIGIVLIAGGLHQEVSKSIIYSCLAFSLGVEMLNIKLRGKETNLRLNDMEDVNDEQ